MIRKKNRLLRHVSLSGAYYHLATYGENPYKPALYLLLIGICGSIYWYSCSCSSTIPPTATTISSVKFNASSTTQVNLDSSNTLDSNSLWPIERTLINIISIYEAPSLGDILIRIFSLVVIGALGIALRRKIERRFRH